MANDENLVPLNKRTKKEQREIQVKGGKASGKARKEKKTMKQAAELLLSLDVSKSQQSTKATMRSLGVKEEDMTYSMSIMVAMLAKAAGGDVQAARFLRDTVDDVNNKRYGREEVQHTSSLADRIEEAYRRRMKEQNNDADS